MRAGLSLLLAAALVSASRRTRARGRPRDAAAREAAAVGTPRAAKLVKRSRFEPRPANREAVPAGAKSAATLRVFRAQSDMPYARSVTGRFTGTTDEVIQWAARKWGLKPDLLRGVDDGRVVVADEHARRQRRLVQALPGPPPLPLHRARVPGVPRRRGAQRGLLRRDPARVLRREAGLAEHGLGRRAGSGDERSARGRGGRYRRGDLWGSVGAWFSGRWWNEPGAATSRGQAAAEGADVADRRSAKAEAVASSPG